MEVLYKTVQFIPNSTHLERLFFLLWSQAVSETCRAWKAANGNVIEKLVLAFIVCHECFIVSVQLVDPVMTIVNMKSRLHYYWVRKLRCRLLTIGKWKALKSSCQNMRLFNTPMELQERPSRMPEWRLSPTTRLWRYKAPPCFFFVFLLCWF